MKKLRGSFLVNIAVAFAIFGGAFLFYNYLNNKCHETVKFSVGAVDGRFKISKDDVLTIAKSSANRWNMQTGEPLLQYDPNADLKIELIYDQRQTDLDKLNSMSNSLETNKQSVENTNKQFESALNSFQKDLAAYNATVDYWNKRGGAPADIYASLQKQKADLDERHDSLVKMSQSLNIKVDNYNADLQNLKNEVDSRKNVIVTQGLYIPAQDKIEIFTFGNKDELGLVLMHELGHSLGLDHDQSPESLMYYLLGEQDLKNPTLTSEDKAMLDNKCKINSRGFWVGLFNLAKTTN